MMPVGRYGNAYSRAAQEDAEIEAPMLERLYGVVGYIRVIDPLFAIDSEILDHMPFLGQPQQDSFFQLDSAMIVGN
jgi:hypothetical protein